MISVIMCAYNMEEFIAESIDSVLRQTYTDWELIVVDDGSTDSTAGIVAGYERRDSRIRCFHKENGGLPVARNYGVACSRGEYVTFLDSDDLWNEEFLQKTHALIESGLDFVYARTEEFFPDGRRNIVGPKDCVRGRLENFIHRTDELRLRFHISAILVRRGLIDRYGLTFEPGITQSEDTSFLIKVLCVTEVDYVPEVLSYYRRRAGSMTTEFWKPMNWADTVIIYERLESFVQEHYPQGLVVFHRMRNYKTYRFILQCLRLGYREEAKRYIRRWRPWLLEFSRGHGKRGDRLKCRLLASNRDWALKIAGKV